MSESFVEGEGLRLQAAMLRLVMTRKSHRGKDPVGLIDRVARETGVEPSLFRAFLVEHDVTTAKALGLRLGAQAPVMVRAGMSAKKIRSPVA